MMWMMFTSIIQIPLVSTNLFFNLHFSHRKYGGSSPFVGYYAGRTPVLMAVDPKLIKDVLITNFKSFNANELSTSVDKKSDPIFARNPFFLSGEEWKEKRTELSPAFTNNKLKTIYPLVADVCSKLTAYIKRNAKKEADNGFDAKQV